MINFPVVLLLTALLSSGCASNVSVTQNNQGSNRGYFSDASKCSQATMNKQRFNVPTSGTQTVVEIPVGYDANAYVDCMKHTGWPVPSADPTEYLNVSTACLKKAQGTENLDESYANCIKRSRFNVEVITDK
jgi:uncharacterized protein YceK